MIREAKRNGTFYSKDAGPTSDLGSVEGGGRLFDQNGKLAAVVYNDDYPLPPYPVEERIAGVAGKMVLSVTLKRDGRVKEIHAVTSLSPGLDKAIDTVRSWKFKGCQDEPLCTDGNFRTHLKLAGPVCFPRNVPPSLLERLQCNRILCC